MAQLLNIRLSRNDTSCPWGFRLQGGKDFGTPLLIQKVNGNSLAEKAGLQVGDAVVRVNNHELFDQRHKDAQDAIVKAGNSFEMTVQRGGNNTWKPAVVPIGSTPSPNPYISSAPSPVTKTSLKAGSKPSSPAIGSGYNSTPKTFNSQVNGSNYVNGNGSVKAIVNKQYNSPVGIYSDESIAETLSAQAEVLAGGVLGVNFKKNERDYNAETSEVFKMVQEAEKEPKEPEPEQNDASGIVVPPPVTGLRHVSAPQYKPPSTPQSTLAPGQNICADCERLIVGVFVKIKDKNLHVECFKCATCGTSLKNVGYYNINNKLYCDIHAKMIARQNPPSPNLYPATDSQRPFSPAKTSPSSNLANNQAPRSPQSPAPTLAPIPFHAPRASPTHVTPPVLSNQCVNNSYGKPSQQAPLPTNQGCTFSSLNTGQFATIKTKHYDKGAVGGGSKTASSVGYSAPRRGRGVLNPQNLTPGARIPLCAQCSSQIRGPFVTALGKIWCPEHFLCVNSKCNRSLMDIGFVEEPSGLYCEYCFEQFLAPGCAKCSKKIKGDCLNAIGKHFHPECFTCAYCGKFFGNSPFFLEESLPYCENDWNELFTTKCFACGFPIEAGDRWVEALNNNYHSPCFNCTMCKTNLEGQSFYAKGGRPFCKNHAR